jgi:3-oxoacyl-[acyl-carrier protein] reductase
MKRILFITGGNGGIGQAVAREFLSESPENRVWLGVNQHRDHADALAESSGGRCRCLALDVTSRAGWDGAVAAILAAEDGQLDVLVNNAGTHQDMLLGTMPWEVWDRVVSTNLDSVYLGCHAVLPAMISRKHGRIINIASLSGLMAPLGQTNYAAAKAGVIALGQSLAKEVARIGITVNTVCPGYIETGALAGICTEKRSELARQIPMRRFGRPEEVAAAVRFFACDAASYITGSTLKIDGGIL